jgi:hypothetical protein
MLQFKLDSKNAKTRAARAGGAPAAIAMVRNAAYMATTWAVLLAKK